MGNCATYSAYAIILPFIIVSKADGGSITWYEPSPVETITDPAVIRTVNGNLTKGFEEKLSWNFSLPADLSILTVTLVFTSSAAGSTPLTVATYIEQHKSISIPENLKNRFNASWIPNRITLTVFNAAASDIGEFTCNVLVFTGGGTNTWTRIIQVTLLVPPKITTTTESQAVVEGDTLTLSCTADGTPLLSYTWTRLSDNSTVSSNIRTLANVSRQENGTYRCTADNGVGRPATMDVIITVHFPPNIIDISRNETVNEGHIVVLNCTADGNPTPNITWTRLSDNSSVNRLLNITGKQDEGFYRCAADNGIGIPDRSNVFIHVQNYRPTDTNLATNLTNNAVVVSEPFNLICRADANPPAHYRLYKEQTVLTTVTDSQPVGIFTTSVGERIKQLTYSCTPFNYFGDGPSDTVIVTLHYNPANVTLVANTTENENCSDLLRVNFSCVASDANPAVTKYQLYGGEKEFNASESGTWITEIFQGGEYVYSCSAEHSVGNVTSSNNATLTFNVPVQISVRVISGSETPVEGGAVSLNCNASGFPVPTVTWSKLGDDGFVNRCPWLNFTSITRDNAGNYTCHANNTCGTDSSVKFINVQYKPVNVTLNLNMSTSKACQGDTVEFKCEAEGNPAVKTYILYKSDVILENMGSDGVARRPLHTGGQVTYKCEATNSVGTTASANKTVIVAVPASVTSVSNTTVVKEGENVTLHCSVSGDPAPNVSWVNEKNDVMVVNAPWKLLHIDRNYAGEYKCTASNECGSDRKTTNISVEFSPSATSSDRNKTVPSGTPYAFTCMADGNPSPSIRWYKGTEPSGTVLSRDTKLEFTSTSLSDTGLYTCFVSNSLGNDSLTFELTVVESTSSPTPSPTTPGETTVLTWQITLTITNKDCNDFPEEEFRAEVEKSLEHLELDNIEIKTRCGSVVVDLSLGFNQSVGVNDVICTLNDAANNGKFGDFNVDSNSIKQTSSPSPTGTVGRQDCNCSCNLVLMVIIGILAAIIIVLIIIVVWQHKKGTATRPYEVPPGDTGFYDNEIAMEEMTPAHIPPSSSNQQLSMLGRAYMDLQEATRSEKYPSDQSRPTIRQKLTPPQPVEYAPLNPKTRSWEVARDKVTVDKIIGKGAFGQVAKATAIELPFRTGKTAVAVKMLKPNAPETDKKDLLSELDLMKTLKPHPHIIKLMGCVTVSEPLLVLIEYVPYGDLLGYLRKSRGLNDTYYKDPDIKPQTSLTSQQLMKFAWQIADGMSYLSSRKIIHRDLAARNVLVGEGETCKVTDFGMARDVQQENIYERKTKGRLPVKWTAYESLLYGTYTTKSDIWSYGVVLYEIFTIGGSPYPRMDGRKIANVLQHGYRMPKPQHVDDSLYQIMMNCWQNDPEARPSFRALTKLLKEMEKQHKKLINMHIYDNELYAKVEDLNV